MSLTQHNIIQMYQEIYKYFHSRIKIKSETIHFEKLKNFFILFSKKLSIRQRKKCGEKNKIWKTQSFSLFMQKQW